MARITEASVRSYLAERLGRPIRVLALTQLGGSPSSDVKGYGYGVPLRVDYAVGRERRSVVLETLNEGPFGHEHPADRARIILWSHGAFNTLPRHARSLDVGAVTRGGRLLSLGEAEEFFAFREYVAGREYVHDLERLRGGSGLTDLDRARADALCDYLVGIHGVHGPDPGLYARRIRELVGHGECIMGILDAYAPDDPDAPAARLSRIEAACVGWRWRLKGRAHRLRQVHGDFHPWNILFRDGADFSVLDRSRGEWGEPADDVACLSLNYLFFALQGGGPAREALLALFERFWRRYLEASGDREMLRVIGPFFAFRGLVMACRVWYPRLDREVRTRILGFVEAVLGRPEFDPARAGADLGLAS